MSTLSHQPLRYAVCAPIAAALLVGALAAGLVVPTALAILMFTEEGWAAPQYVAWLWAVTTLCMTGAAIAALASSVLFKISRRGTRADR